MAFSSTRLCLAAGLLLLPRAAASQAALPEVSSAKLVAHFQANASSLTVDASNNISVWAAENNAAATLQAEGTDDPANIRFNPTGMGGLGTVEVDDFPGDNRYLRGSLGTAFSGATIFWVGYYAPERNGSLDDQMGQYAYTLGRANGQGTQINHQIDSGNIELYGGAGTQAGNAIDYLNGHDSVWHTNYYPGPPGHNALANGRDLEIPADDGYGVAANDDLVLFSWQDSSGTAGDFNFVGNMSDLVIYDAVLDAQDAAQVTDYLASRLPAAPPEPPGPVTLYARLDGLPNEKVPGFVPHGNRNVTGYARLIIHPDNTMDYAIVVQGNEYALTQAHLYNINETSGTSGNRTHGDSIICWGGRWQSGGDSDDFLQGTGYSNPRLQELLDDPQDWMLMFHTEGGHFATDESGGLIPYDPAVHEVNELGVPENERPTRFNNRVGRTLLDLTLRQDNTHDPAAPFFDANDSNNMADEPFHDANGVRWVEYHELSGSYGLTAEAMVAGYDLETRYLFHLYDDQGPVWDFGGPEGAFGGFLTTQPIPEPSSGFLLGGSALAVLACRRWRGPFRPCETHG